MFVVKYIRRNLIKTGKQFFAEKCLMDTDSRKMPFKRALYVYSKLNKDYKCQSNRMKLQ